MSLTALVWVLLYGVAAVGAISSPLYGIFGYLLEYYQRPALVWWGKDLPDLRWNFLIALVATASYFLNSNSLPPRRRVVVIPLVLLLLQAINTSVVTLWAVNQKLSWEWSVACWKLVVVYVLFSGIVRSQRALNFLIVFQILGTAYWGYDALDARRAHSRLEGIGSGDTQNSNTLAAHILTIIPLTIVFAFFKEPRWMQGIAVVSLPLIINLLVLTNSRGATLGLLASGVAAFVLSRRGMRRYVLLSAAAGGLVLFLLADTQFITRQQTTVAPEDASATNRFELWKGSLGMIADYPFGAGGRGYHFLSPKYVPYLSDRGDDEGRSSHNTYIQVTAEWGIQGLLLFSALIGYTFMMLHRVRSERKTADRVYFTSLAIQLGLIATLVSAFFSNRLYGESIYWLCGMATALYSMRDEEEAAPTIAQSEAA